MLCSLRPSLRFRLGLWGRWLTWLLACGGLAIRLLPAAYAAPISCARCHTAETAAFAQSTMTHALESAQDGAILRANPKMAVTRDGYTWEITRAGDETFYTVTDGNTTFRTQLGWAFGQGAAGQTYLFERDGYWYESLVSYYSALHGLDLTMGAQIAAVHNVKEAAGRLLAGADARDCFACHATGTAKGSQFTLAAMTAGVQCERCHGTSQAHVQSMSPMRKLGSLSTEQMSDFCGECHRSWSEIAAKGPRGVLNVRFQPYRLTLSKCYDAEDRRIRCTACHNPHRGLETSARAYDSKCLACHSSAGGASGARVRNCRVAKQDCVTCHMPAVDLPGAHKKFTDHRIRIAKAGEKYPD